MFETVVVVPRVYPGIFAFDNLMSLTLSPPIEAVEGLINEGQNAIFAGYFGVGKTMFAGQLSISLAIGREFLGRKVRRPYKVVFIDFETGPTAIRERISKQVEGAKLSPDERERLSSNWIYVNALDEECPFYGLQSDKHGLEKLAAFINEVGGEILIIDNLGWFATGDLSDPQAIKDFYKALRGLRTNCESLKDGIILLLHHLTKPGEKSGRCSLLTSPREYLSMARGSQRLLDFAECRLALAEEVVDDQVVHIVNGVNRTAVVQPLVIQLGTESLSFDLHEDSELRYKQAFEGKAKQKQVFEAFPKGEFTWTDVKSMKVEGKVVNPGTLSSTLTTARLNQFVAYDSTTKKYRKIFEPGAE